MKIKTIHLILFLCTIQGLYAGCGACRPSKVSLSKDLITKKVGLVDELPKDNVINGNVLMSCGMCNFMTTDNECILSIKVGKNVYPTDNMNIDAHGDSHAIDGYCNVIKKVYVLSLIHI